MSSVATIRVEDLAAHAEFCRLDSIAGIAHDLRYATADNFDGRVLYVGIDCAWLRREAASGLGVAGKWLAQHHPDYMLLVLDALRPHRVQEAIWADIKGTPAERYFADPARGSIHSYGMAVDVTLVEQTGHEIDMGSGFDEMTPRSHPALELEQRTTGAIDFSHIANREILRGAMAAGGFQGIATEWWHFNFGEPAVIRREFPRVV